MLKRIFLILSVIIITLLPVRNVYGSDTLKVNANGQENGLMPEDFRVFPNPVVNRKFTVEFFRQSITEIRISNIAGQMVFIKKFNFPVQRHEVLTGDFPDGIYLLRMTSDSGSSRTIKLLISTER